MASSDIEESTLEPGAMSNLTPALQFRYVMGNFDGRCVAELQQAFKSSSGRLHWKAVPKFITDDPQGLLPGEFKTSLGTYTQKEWP